MDVYFDLNGYRYSVPAEWLVILPTGEKVAAEEVPIGETAYDPLLSPNEDGYMMGKRCS